MQEEWIELYQASTAMAYKITELRTGLTRLDNPVLLPLAEYNITAEEAKELGVSLEEIDRLGRKDE